MHWVLSYMADQKKETPPSSRRPKYEFFVGTGLVVLVLGLLTLLFAFRGRAFDSHDWVAFYAGIALVTGLSFWLLTSTTGTVDLKELGIKLGGGGAVGAAFMLLAWWLTPAPRLLIVDLPGDVRGSGSRHAMVERASADLAHVEVLSGNDRMLVEFREGRGRGSLFFTYFDPSSLERASKCFVVERGAGALRPCPTQKGD